MRKSDNYAGNQVKLFLGELKNGNHSSKVKALQHFQNYIKTYVPSISDDNVDFLYTGILDETNTLGLLYWCGVDSDKHDGQLKRICGPLISFLRWLVTFEADTIYFDRFVHLPQEDLYKINFPRHILKQGEGKLALNIPGQSRGGSTDDAFYLLSLLINEHKNIDDEPDPINCSNLLRSNKLCQSKFEEWLQKSNLQQYSDYLAKAKNQSSINPALQQRNKYAKTWNNVNFKVIPTQEDEDVDIIVEEDEMTEPPPILDPLGICDTDLRNTQEIYVSERLNKRAIMTRRNTAALLAPDLSTIVKTKSSLNMNGQTTIEEDDEEDEDDDDIFAKVYTGGDKKALPSVIPSDKAFSPSLFLTLVHGGTPFDELRVGLDRLKEHLTQQSRRRENLVRSHFGLFVQCADGLEWLKAYHQGVYLQNDSQLQRRASSSNRKSFQPNFDSKKDPFSSKNSAIEKGMDDLERAKKQLEVAKVEAKRTLAPILTCMKNIREIKSTEKILRGMYGLFQYPKAMKVALDRDDLKEVVSLYQRIKAIPSTSLKITQRVQQSAELIVLQLKKNILTTLMSSNSNYNTLIRYADLIKQLEGSSFYIDSLRKTFIRQLVHFLLQIYNVQDKFMSDMMDAYDKGQDLNQSQSTIAVINKSTRPTNNIPSFQSNNNPNNSEDTDINLSLLIQKYTNRRASFTPSGMSRRAGRTRQRGSIKSVSNGMSRGSFDGSDTEDNVSLYQGGSVFEDEWMSVDNDNMSQYNDNPNWGETGSVRSDRVPSSPSLRMNGVRKRSYIQEFFSVNGKNSTNANLFTGANPTIEAGGDYAQYLCQVVRKSFSENLLEVINRWFPCLFRLSTAIVQEQITSSFVSGSSTSTSSGINGANKSNTSKFSRGTVTTGRLLSMSLTYVIDILTQSINGFQDSYLTSSLPPDIIDAYNELVQFHNSTIPASFQISIACPELPSSSGPFLANYPRFPTVVSSPICKTTLIEAHRLEIYQELFVLYEMMETSMKASYQTLQSLSNTLSSNPILPSGAALPINPVISNVEDSNSAFNPGSTMLNLFKTQSTKPFFNPLSLVGSPGANSGPTTMKPMFGNSATISITRDITEFDFESSNSPYYEPMFSLAVFAKEGETIITSLILDTLLERSYSLSDQFLSDFDGRNSNQVDTNIGFQPSFDGPKSVEVAVAEFEQLLLKGYKALNGTIRRPEWVLHLVYEHLFHKIVTSFVERLKRKMVVIEETKPLLFLPTTMNSSTESGKTVPLNPFLDQSANGYLFMSPSTQDSPVLRSRTGRSTSTNGLSAKRNGSTGNTRASMSSNVLLLQSLEEDLCSQLMVNYQTIVPPLDSLLQELSSSQPVSNPQVPPTVPGYQLIAKLMQSDLTTSVGASTTFATGENNKTILILDFLRGCIRLRGSFIPSFLIKLWKRFPLSTLASEMEGNGISDLNQLLARSDSGKIMLPSLNQPNNSQNNAPAMSLNNPNNQGGSSLLNRLFAFESVPESPTDPVAPAVSAASSKKPFSEPESAKESTVIYSTVGKIQSFLSKTLIPSVFPSLSTDSSIKLATSYFTELLQVEDQGIKLYLSMKEKEIINILRSHFSIIFHHETNSPTLVANNSQSLSVSLPSHLVKLFLSLYQEKQLLEQTLNNLFLEIGGNTDDFLLLNQNNITNIQPTTIENTEANLLNTQRKSTKVPTRRRSSYQSTVSYQDDISDGDDFFDNGNNRMNANNQSSATMLGNIGVNPQALTLLLANTNSLTPYSIYLYEELCANLITIYEDLVKRLLVNQLYSDASISTLPNISQAISSNSYTLSSPVTLFQAFEELDYLRTIFRPILSGHNVFQRSYQYLTPPEVSFILREKEKFISRMSPNLPFLRKDELLSKGALFASMIIE